MTALNILRAALRNIFADLPQMLRIFALPGLMMIACVPAVEGLRTVEPSLPQRLVATGAIMTLIYSGLWCTVSLHRRILLAERFG